MLPAVRPLKKRKLRRGYEPSPLLTEIRSLRRVVNSSRPEVRQASYVITIPLNSTIPVKLIDPTLIDAGTEEIRLHRVSVCWLYKSPDYPWGLIYSPRQGYVDNQLPDGGNPFSPTNYLQHLDATKQRVFARKNFSPWINTGTAVSDDEILEMDVKFNIPMKVGMSGPGVQTVNHNQLFWIGGNWQIDGARVIDVTVWYSSA